MINPTFASFKPTKINPVLCDRPKQVHFKAHQPKTFQELKGNPNIGIKAAGPTQPSPSEFWRNRKMQGVLQPSIGDNCNVAPEPHRGVINYANYPAYMKKSCVPVAKNDHAGNIKNYPGGSEATQSIPTSGKKLKPQLPSKRFVTAKKQHKQKDQKFWRPSIVSPSLLKNRSFVHPSFSSNDSEAQKRRPSEGLFPSNSLNGIAGGHSFDSFEGNSDDINRSQGSSNSDSYSYFNSSKLNNQDDEDQKESNTKDSFISCQENRHQSSGQQNSLNFSRKLSFKNYFEQGQSKDKALDQEVTQLPRQELSIISLMNKSGLASSLESINSSHSSYGNCSSRENNSMSFHKKFEYYRRSSQINKVVHSERKITLSEFDLIDEIGQGKYGKVYMAQHRQTGFLCALKTVSKARIKEQNIEEPFIRQIKIQMYLNHPNIVKLYGFFHDEENIYLMMECCVTGHLLKLMKEKKILEETEILDIICNVFEAVSFIHCHGIIHRDLKPENIVIQNGVYKLCDFGWAAYAKGDSRTTFCGTPLYVCPQILKGDQYDEKADVWGLGVLTYELAYGRVPFPIWNQSDMAKIVKDPVYFPSWTGVSEKMQNLIKSMLNKDPIRRLSLNEILSSSLLSEYMGPRFGIRSQIQSLF